MIKKYRGGLKLLYLLLFFIQFATFSKVSADTAWYKDVEFTQDEWAMIMDSLNLTERYSGDIGETARQSYNRWARVQLASDNTFTLLNLIMCRNNNGYIAWTLINGGTTDDYPIWYNSTFVSGIIGDGTYSVNSLTTTQWTSWKTNSSGEITGVNTTTLGHWFINYNQPTNVTSATTSLSPYQTTSYPFTWTNSTMNWKGIISFWIVSLKSRTYSYGYGNYLWTNVLDLGRTSSGETPTPTPTPSPTGGGGEGGSTAGIISAVDNLNNTVLNQSNRIIDKMLTSGEIKDATTTGIITANNDYWGTSGELTGTQQENEIGTTINGIIDNVSGEMTQNQAYNQLNQIENGFLNFFERNHDEQWYDLIITWNDVEYNNVKIIESGEINFSKMCREIPILGTVRTTIRTIMNFWICFSLVKQIWNLILATLGIDNPYLYEDPEEEAVNFMENENTGEWVRYRRKGAIRRVKKL